MAVALDLPRIRCSGVAAGLVQGRHSQETKEQTACCGMTHASIHPKSDLITPPSTRKQPFKDGHASKLRIKPGNHEISHRTTPETIQKRERSCLMERASLCVPAAPRVSTPPYAASARDIRRHCTRPVMSRTLNRAFTGRSPGDSSAGFFTRPHSKIFFKRINLLLSAVAYRRASSPDAQLVATVITSAFRVEPFQEPDLYNRASCRQNLRGLRRKASHF